MTKLDDIAAAIQTYSVRCTHHENRLSQYEIYHGDNNDTPVARFASFAESSAECARLNARAAIEALREPTKEMLAAPENDLDWPSNHWRTMIDSLLKSE